MDTHGNTDAMLRLAVGVALVPIGALVTLTAENTESRGENNYIQLIEINNNVPSLLVLKETSFVSVFKTY